MKILIATNHSYMLYRFRKELIAKLLEEHEVVISTPFVGHETDFEAMGCHMIETQVDRRGINPKTDLKLVNCYRKILKEVQPDQVITYSIKPNIYMGFLCRQKKIPYFANVQGLGTAFQNPKLAAIVTRMFRVSLKKAEKVFFENTTNAQEFLNRNILSKADIHVLPGAGINLEEYRYEEYLVEGPIRFLYLGRIMKEKGMDEFLYAAEKLKAIYGDRIAFDLVGFFEDEYKLRVEDLQQREIVTFHGFQTEVYDYYRKSHCVVLPSYHEGLSNVLLEAAAVGRPVITSDVPGCREAVLDGESGLLCPVKDREMLFAKMKEMLLFSDEKREMFGQAGRTYMEREFSKDKVVGATIKILFQRK